MTLSPADLQALVAVATAAARRAGEHVAQATPTGVEHKPGAPSPATAVVTDVDRESQAIILETLRPTLARFDLAVLAEEQPDDGARHEKPYFWCVDPLDGTLPFVESRPGYAVSVALVARDGAPLIGAVYDPVQRTLIHAARGLGVFRDGQPWAPRSQPAGDTLQLCTDASFLAWRDYPRTLDGLRHIAATLGLRGVTVQTGAAVMNACRVLGRPPACYFKFPKPQDGGGSLWDYAATACLFAEAGAAVSDADGRPLELNREGSTFMNHRGVVFASDRALAEAIRALRPDRPTPP
ncbi:MAG: inositol monophosphatase family protein [Myxococcota bacterium]